MTVSVLIPFSSGDGDRVAALGRARGQYQRLGWQVVIGGTPGPWCKAAAVAECLRWATGDMLVIADADCLCDGLPDAVDAALMAGWAMPHQRVHRLAPDPTQAVLAGAEPIVAMATTERPYPATKGGGIVAIHRDTYRQVPLDPRFVGWGQEDESWGYALHAIAGPGAHLDWPLFHLWHPPAARHTRRVGSTQGRELRNRYHRAIHDPDAMRALLEEVTSCPTLST